MRVTDESFAALIRLFKSEANPKWVLPVSKGGYSDATKDGWGRELDFMARPNCLGSVPRRKMRPMIVQAYFDAIADRPGKQKAGLAVLRQLEKWARVRDLLPAGITDGVEIGKSEGGHIPWTEDQVALAEANAEPRMARAVTLAANTGQRGAELVRMGWTDIETYEGVQGINVVQKKTRKRVFIPITSELAAAMATWERRPGPFLTEGPGEPWTRPRLTKAWSRERDGNDALRPLRLKSLDLDEGVDPGKDQGLVLHGLRGFSCIRLRRAGASESQIADMVGMSIEMVANYCRFAAQRDSAVAAVLHLKAAAERRKIR